MDVALVPTSAHPAQSYGDDRLSVGYQARERTEISAALCPVQRTRGASGGFEETITVRRPSRTKDHWRLVMELGQGTGFSTNARLASRSKIQNHFRQEIFSAAGFDGAPGLRVPDAAIRHRDQRTSALPGPGQPDATPDHGHSRTHSCGRARRVRSAYPTADDRRVERVSPVRVAAAL